MSNNQKGQTLLELVIVVAVSVIIVGALVFATISSLRNAGFSKNQAQATKLAQEGIEKMRNIRDRNEEGKVDFIKNDDVTRTSKFSDLWLIRFSCSDNINCYFRFVSDRLVGNGAPITFEDIPNTAFHRQILIEDQDDGTSQKKVTSIVRWNDFSGPHESRLTTILRRL